MAARTESPSSTNARARCLRFLQQDMMLGRDAVYDVAKRTLGMCDP